MSARKLFGLIVVLVLITLVLVSVTSAQGPAPRGNPRAPRGALGTGFTYQGQLKQSGNPVNGTCDFQFGLWDDASVGTLQGVTQTVTATVTSGLFTTVLNAGGEFGASAFNGNQRWLAIAVRCPSGSGSYTALTTRQELTAAPYALYATNGPFWSLTGNSGTAYGTNFVGTMDNVSFTLRANNVVGWRLAPSGTNTPNLIGGYSGNTVGGGAVGVTIGGGGANGNINHASANYATIGGGFNNTASGLQSPTIGGGFTNVASGINSTVGGGSGNNAVSPYSTVAGGSSNNASKDYATVAGGFNNTASGFASFVGGGGYDGIDFGGNTASGMLSTIPGGMYNSATMTYTFAAGYRAKAVNQGSFVWGDSTNADFSSTANNQFLVRANGGVGIGTNSPSAQLNVSSSGNFDNPQARIDQTTSNDHARLRFNVNGASSSWDIAVGDSTNNTMKFWNGQDIMTLSTGTTHITMIDGATESGGNWVNFSDRNAKENYSRVNSRDILARVATLPVTTWNYKTEGASVRHIGPVAQDFAQAFRVGQDDTHIATTDADGVALASIQGLYQIVQEQDAKIAAQQKQIDDLNARLTALENGTVAAQSPLAGLANNAWLVGTLLVAVVWVGRNRRGGAR